MKYTARDIQEMTYAKHNSGARYAWYVRFEVRKRDTGEVIYSHGMPEIDITWTCPKRDALAIAKRIAKDGYTGVYIARYNCKTGADEVERVRVNADSLWRDEPRPAEASCTGCGERLSCCQCDGGWNEARERERIGNTPTCEDCGAPQDHCVCANEVAE